jgi:fructose-1,6-bisphosphatase/inositol monophosphatase family enzyme
MSVLLEAGATVSDEQGKPIEIGVGEIAFEYFVVSNGLCHDSLLGLIAPK